MWISKNSTNTILILRSSCVEFVWKMRSVSGTSVSRVYFQTTKETTNTASDNMADCAFHGITTHRRRVVWRACSIVDPSFPFEFEEHDRFMEIEARKGGLIDTWLYISLMSELGLPFWSAFAWYVRSVPPTWSIKGCLPKVDPIWLYAFLMKP